MTTPLELPPLPGWSVEGEKIADDGRYVPLYDGDDVESRDAAREARERILMQRIAALEDEVRDCREGLDAAIAEAEQNQADAERYRILRTGDPLANAQTASLHCTSAYDLTAALCNLIAEYKALQAAADNLLFASINIDLMAGFREQFPTKHARLREAIDAIKPLLPDKGET